MPICVEGDCSSSECVDAFCVVSPLWKDEEYRSDRSLNIGFNRRTSEQDYASWGLSETERLPLACSQQRRRS